LLENKAGNKAPSAAGLANKDYLKGKQLGQINEVTEPASEPTKGSAHRGVLANPKYKEQAKSGDVRSLTITYLEL
jgi:hypothetical protein